MENLILLLKHNRLELIDELSNDLLQLRCQAGHIHEARENEIHHCKMCVYLANMKGVSSYQPKFSLKSTYFKLVCNEGHKFLILNDLSQIDEECPVCDLLEYIHNKYNLDLIYDKDQIYKDKATRLRFHCNSLHSTDCDPDGRREKDVKSSVYKCDRDFIITETMFKHPIYKDMIRGVNSHFISKRYEIYTMHRIFEIFYEMKFLDVVESPNVIFTGYNSKIKLAFNHENDWLITPHLKISAEWASSNKITVITVSKKCTTSLDVCENIISQLLKLGLIAGDKSDIIKYIGKIIINNNKVSYYFDPMCK